MFYKSKFPNSKPDLALSQGKYLQFHLWRRLQAYFIHATDRACQATFY